MVLWMIHEQDSLLAMGKLWSLDFVGADIDRLYIVFVTWPFISPECFKASSLEGFFSLSAWSMDSYTLGGLFVPIPFGISHMISMIHIIHTSIYSAIMRRHFGLQSFFFHESRGSFQISRHFRVLFLVQKSALVGTHSNLFKRWIGSMSFDPKVLAIASGALGFLYIMAVEPLNPRSKRQEGYNPEPYAFQWKARFDEWMGWKPQTRL